MSNLPVSTSSWNRSNLLAALLLLLSVTSSNTQGLSLALPLSIPTEQGLATWKAALHPPRQSPVNTVQTKTEDSGWLERWLNRLVVELPDINTEKMKFKIKITEGVISNFKISDISTKPYGNYVDITALGLGATAALHLDVQQTIVPWFHFSGTINATLGEGTLGGPVSFGQDSGQPPLPSSIIAHNCGCNIKVTKLKFSGAGLKVKTLELLKKQIKGLLSANLGGVICGQLTTAVEGQGSLALKNASLKVREFLKTSPMTPTALAPLPEPKTDFVDIGHNPGLVVVQKALKVLGNASSKFYMNRIMHGQNFSRFALANLSLKTSVAIAQIGVVNITLQDVSLSGLDTWSKLSLNTIDATQVGLAMGLGDLAVNATIKLEVEPTATSPVRGGELTELFQVSLGLKDLTTGAAIAAALNQTYLGSLTIDQLPSLGCLAAGMNAGVFNPLETKASMTLPSVMLGLRSFQGDRLDSSLDAMLNAVFALVLHQFGPALEVVASHGVAVPLRDMMNLGIEHEKLVAPSCPDPAETYSNEGAFVFACGMAMVLLGLFIVSVILWHFCRRRQKREVLLVQPGPQAAEAGMVAPVTPSLGHLSKSPSPLSPYSASASSSCGISPYGAKASSQAIAALRVIQPPEPAASSSFRQIYPAPDEQGSLDSAPSAITGAASCETGASPPWQPWDCLAFHPRISPVFRWGLPLLDIIVVTLMIGSNCSVATTVHVDLLGDSQPIVDIPQVFGFSLISSIKDMWDARVYALAWLVIIFSGVWPYCKLGLMLVCWFGPTKMIGAGRRLSFLEFLDNWGKWSLVDAFVMVLFMVSFKFNLNTHNNGVQGSAEFFQEADASAALNVYVLAGAGFHVFLMGTVGSLVVGHLMTASNRYALQLGEYSANAVSEEYSQRKRLCNVLRPPGYLSGKIFAWGPLIAMSLSLALVIVGLCIDCFAFTFQGLGGYMLAPGEHVRAYSVIGLGLAVPAASGNPHDPGNIWLAVVFLLFTALAVVTYFAMLIVLWCAPLSPRLQCHFLVACQTLNAWSGIDVFVVSILASVMEISQFVEFIIGNKCDLIDNLVAKTALAQELIHETGSARCFQIQTSLRWGFWILLAAAVLSSIMGRLMIARCKKALGMDDSQVDATTAAQTALMESQRLRSASNN